MERAIVTHYQVANDGTQAELSTIGFIVRENSKVLVLTNTLPPTGLTIIRQEDIVKVTYLLINRKRIYHEIVVET